METIHIDRTKLMTQSEYARKMGISRARVNQLVKSKDIKTIKIQGATLVYLG